MSKTEHTPTPWGVGKREPYVEVWGRMRMNTSPIVASLECEPRRANAEFIVRAVNSHDEMLAALEHARHVMWEYGFSEDELQPIRTAISRATGQAGEG